MSNPGQRNSSYHCTTVLLASRTLKNNSKCNEQYDGLLAKLLQSRWLEIGQVVFLCVCGPRQSQLKVHKLSKKECDQYPAFLTEKAWSIEDLLFGFWRKFFCWTWQSYLACSGSQSQCVIWSILPAHRASHIII